MPALQRAFVAALRECLPAAATLQEETAPAWLIRPGRDHCGQRWPLVRTVYADLTGLSLPELMPPRERRRLDAVLTTPDGACRALEIDESQHFGTARALTLTRYEDHGVDVAFDVRQWATRSRERAGREARGGGWAAPKPPLFPGPGGRHRQRAFRDLLADLLPPVWGWQPTVRIDDDEVRAVLQSPSPPDAARDLVSDKIGRRLDE